jgi:hypothetical protein
MLQLRWVEQGKQLREEPEHEGLRRHMAVWAMRQGSGQVLEGARVWVRRRKGAVAAYRSQQEEGRAEWEAGDGSGLGVPIVHQQAEEHKEPPAYLQAQHQQERRYE